MPQPLLIEHSIIAQSSLLNALESVTGKIAWHVAPDIDLDIKVRIKKDAGIREISVWQSSQ